MHVLQCASRALAGLHEIKASISCEFFSVDDVGHRRCRLEVHITALDGDFVLVLGEHFDSVRTGNQGPIWQQSFKANSRVRARESGDAVGDGNDRVRLR
jgi:hypothetical protein